MEIGEGLTLGIPELDEQHGSLLERISLIRRTVTGGERWSSVHSAIGRLAREVQVHFAVEESLMRMHRYPDLSKHVEEHREFSSQLEALKGISLKAAVSDDMAASLQDWMEKHIRTSDRNYAWYLPRVRVPLARRKKLLLPRLRKAPKSL